MTLAVHRPGDFLGYPTNRVAGTIATAAEMEAVMEALVETGVPRQDIDILHGDQALHRLDLTGAEHGPLARVQRSVLRTAARHGEFQHLLWHVDDIKAGRFVVMAKAASAQDRREITSILRRHGATRITFYGRWAWEVLDDDTGNARPSGNIYETSIDGAMVRLTLGRELRVSVTPVGGGAFDIVSPEAAILRQGLLMVSWVDPSGNAVVHVGDLESGVAHVSTARPNGSVSLVTRPLGRPAASDWA